MDGHFVPAITFGSQLIGAVHNKMPEVYLDCHMMVSKPDQVRGVLRIHRDYATDATERGTVDRRDR